MKTATAPIEGRFGKDIPNGPTSWYWDCKLCSARTSAPGGYTGACMRGFQTKRDAVASFARHLDHMHSVDRFAPIAPDEDWPCACVKRDGAGQMTAIRINAHALPFCTKCGVRRPRVQP